MPQGEFDQLLVMTELRLFHHLVNICYGLTCFLPLVFEADLLEAVLKLTFGKARLKV